MSFLSKPLHARHRPIVRLLEATGFPAGRIFDLVTTGSTKGGAR